MDTRDQVSEPGIGRFLRAELAPYPGRLNLALRAVLSSALVIVISMALQVPFASLSIITVLYVTQTNVVLTRLVAALSVVGVTLATASSVLLLKLTYNQPLVRIVATSAMVFVSLYLMRVTKFGFVFFIGALCFIYAQSFVDLTNHAEQIVRTILWIWVAVTYAAVLTYLINTLLLPAEPARQLVAEMRRQLDVVRRVLECGRGDAPAVGLAPETGPAALALHKLLRFTVMRDPRYRAQQARHLARIAAVAHLYEDALRLAAEPGAGSTPGVEDLREECARLDAAIARGRRYTPREGAVPASRDGEHALVLRMRHTLQALADREWGAAPASGTPARDRLVLPDAWSNPVYAQFALKTLGASLVAYVFYRGVEWNGVHTVMLTCLIVAQPSLGGTSQKSALRVVGAVIGSALALGLTVFVVPRLDGVVGLLAVTLPVVAVGAWVAAGSERVSYAGTQLVFTFAMALLQGFAPTYDLVEIRDRIIGILLGVALSLVVHATLAPEAEGEAMRQRLADLLRQLGELLRVPVEAPHDAIALAEQYLRARERHAGCEAIIARVELEPEWQQPSGDSERVTSYAQDALGQAEEILGAIEAFQGELAARAAALAGPSRQAVLSLREDVAGALVGYADAIASRPLEAGSPSLVPPGELERSARTAGDETGLGALAASARRLVREVSALPAWTAHIPVPTPLTSSSPA